MYPYGQEGLRENNYHARCLAHLHVRHESPHTPGEVSARQSRDNALGQERWHCPTIAQ